MPIPPVNENDNDSQRVVLGKKKAPKNGGLKTNDTYLVDFTVAIFEFFAGTARAVCIAGHVAHPC